MFPPKRNDADPCMAGPMRVSAAAAGCRPPMLAAVLPNEVTENNRVLHPESAALHRSIYTCVTCSTL
jgi:hypothetical protein